MDVSRLTAIDVHTHVLASVPFDTAKAEEA
jgi:hypothetical protein